MMLNCQEKLALARAVGGFGRSLGTLGALGGLSYGAYRAGNALKSFNPQNPAAVGQSIAQAPQLIQARNDDLSEIMNWANPQNRRR